MRVSSPPSRARRRVLLGVVIGEGTLAVGLASVALWMALRPTAETAPPRPPPVDRSMEIDAVTGPVIRREPVATTSRPVDWLPSQGEDCHLWHERQVCEGPRRVPRPHGPEAQLARDLGLGTHDAARRLLARGPSLEWTLAVRGRYDDAFAWPVEGGRLWRGFGEGWAGSESEDHTGVDIGAPVGTPILAVSDGLVAYADNEIPGYGNIALVIHPDGALSLYAHCSEVWVFAGQQVRRGQPIAEVGTTGITHGAHLHYELRRDGEPVDPMPFLRRGLADAAPGAR